jgi:hypothetical protein
MFKETKMKKNVLLTGLIGALLIAGMMLTACGGDDDPGGLPVPGPDDLPALPTDSGIAPVSTQAEATALLGSFTSGVASLRRQVENLAEQNGDETETETSYRYVWDIKDDTSISGLKINSNGSVVEKWMGDDDIPKANDYTEASDDSNTTIEFIGDKSVSGGTIYEGSRTAEKVAEFERVTFKKVDMLSMSGTINVNASVNESYAYGLTVSYNGKSGKIILDATLAGSLNKDIDIFSEDDYPDMAITLTYSGSLVVYGADNEEVYREDITDKDEFEDVFKYFGGL